MAVGIHAQGFMGIAHESTQGTYIAPTKFFPIRSETLTYQQDTQWRRVIRGLADNLGAIKGNSHVEGNIVMELMEDALPYFLSALATSIPFGADQWNVQIPTASQVFDVSDFSCNVNDNASPQYRLNNNTKAQFVTFGRREVTLKTTRDFNGRTEYDAFKALTAQSVTVAWSKGASASVTISLPNAIRETYDLDGLSDQGTLHMATVQWQGAYDGTTSKSVQLVVVCNENIT
jgi:hypothetical protein